MKNFITLMWCLLSTASYTQSSNNTSTLSVHFNYTGKKIPDSLSVWTYPMANYWEPATDYVVYADSEQHFKFKFPVVNQILNYRINQVNNSKHTQIGIYFTQPGDQIHLEVFETTTGDSLVYSGTGSAKYQLTEQVLNAESEILKSLTYPKAQSSTENLVIALNHMYEILQKGVQDKEILINNYRKTAGEDMCELIGYQYANYDSDWTNYLMYLRSIFKNNAEHLKIIREHFQAHYASFLDTSGPMSLFSERHYQLLLNFLCDRQLFENENGEVFLDKTYDQIKNYSSDPKILDRLLCQFFAYNGNVNTDFSQDKMDALLKEASPYLRSEMGKRIVNNKLLFKKGSPVFDAVYTGLDDKAFRTESLRGKVVLIDVWGEGCGACILFHKWFEENIWPELKDEKNFVVLSIFDGKDKFAWERGIATERYTSRDYLNVSDIPYRMPTHPFFKHYGINYAPFLLLIDKMGKIVERPNGQSGAKKFIAMVRNLANQQ